MLHDFKDIIRKTRLMLLACGLTMILLFGLFWSWSALNDRVRAEDFITITVKSGESLVTYAIRYGVSGSALLAANPHIQSNPDVILPGTELTIPVVTSFVPSVTTPWFYTVREGDTLVELGQRFRIDYTAIRRANQIEDDNLILVGKTYLIPAGPHFHLVQKDEIMETIAPRYGMTLAELRKANPSVEDPNRLFIGQWLFIPIQFDAQPVPLASITGEVFDFAPPASASATPPAATAAPTVAPTEAASPTTAPTAVPTIPASTSLTPGSLITITVQEGESLLAYARRYGVSGSSMLALNPHIRKDPNLIFPGTPLTIPVEVSFAPSISTPFFYVVQPGDTTLSVADKFEMIVEVLLRANPKASLAPGSVLLIPPGPHVYTVKPGDQLRFIAARYVMTPELILKFNPQIEDPDLIFAGQQLFIPIRYNHVPIPFPAK
jgi:LysM repeat protein